MKLSFLKVRLFGRSDNHIADKNFEKYFWTTARLQKAILDTPLFIKIFSKFHFQGLFKKLGHNNIYTVDKFCVNLTDIP